LLVLVLLFAACGGRSTEPEAEGQGIAALDQDDAATPPDAGQAGDKTDANKDHKQKKAGGARGDESGKKKSSNDSASGADTADSDGSAGDSGAAKKAAQPAGATAAVPIPGGTHSYNTDGASTVSGNTSRMPKTTTLTARPPRGEEQTQIRDLRDSDGNGTVVETRLLYREEGVYLTYVKITSTFQGGFTDVRELQPAKAELIAPTGAGPGSAASFSMEGSGTRAEVDIKAKRFEKITVGGSSVNALVVDTRIVFSGAIEGEQNSTSWFWGKHVMAVREQVVTDVSNGPIRVQSQYEAVLRKLP
jgi:hypothetical protein